MLTMALNSCYICFTVLMLKVSFLNGNSTAGYRGNRQERNATKNYGIVIDAGSSGSRIRVYEWEQRSHLHDVPNIKEIFFLKVDHGISEFVDNLKGLEGYIKVLITQAENEVPKKHHEKTPIYVMATAGMRLLREHHANSVISRIDKLLNQTSINPFKYKAGINTRVLSGEEEGAFAWITANYLRGFFKNPEKMKSAGILEMGGASTQIAFRHSASILADKFPVTIGGHIYPLYVHSYLSFGQDHLEERIRNDLYENDMSLSVINNPCMLKGDTAIHDNVMGINKTLTFIGSGNPAECIAIIDKIVYKVQDEDHCYPKPCAIGSVYQPSIRNQTFYALSAFSFTLKNLEVVNNGDNTFSPAETLESAFEYCSKHIDVIRNETGKYEYDYLSTECMMGLYIPILLVKGYGFSNTTRQLKAVNKINNHTIEWPLGAILYENERRDWSCVTPKWTCVTPKMAALSASGHQHGGVLYWTILTTLFYVLLSVN